jgi:ribose transport system substrate-binding protein
VKKGLFLLLVIALLIGLVAACAAPAKTSAEEVSSGIAPSDEMYIGVYALRNIEYCYDHFIGLEAAGKMMGVQTKVVGPADYDVDAFTAAFDQAIAENPAGIIVFGIEPSLAPYIDKSEELGIHVVCVDGDIPGSKRTAFVGTGNYAAGELGGQKLAEAVGGAGKVAILTEPGINVHDQRFAGYSAALEEFPDIEVVQVGDTKADPVLTVQVVAAILQANPDLAGIGCTDAVGGAAAATACDEAGLLGKVKIMSMDRDNSVLEKIVSGDVYGTIVQNTALMPFYALQILYNMNHADIEISNDNEAAGVVKAPAVIDTGVVFVDQTNAEFFIRDYTSN